MAEISITASQWRQVEVGRVVLFTHDKFVNRLATIVEIIDHKRVRVESASLDSTELTEYQALVDGPSKDTKMAVPRHAAALGNLILTHIVIPQLPRAAGRGAVAKAWEKNEVEQKWEESAWAKRRATREKRRNLTDFARFRVLKLNKQVSEALSLRRSHDRLQ